MTTIVDKDACELLDADHIAVKHLFVAYARLAMAPPAKGGSDERAALAAKICRELTVHAQIEEEIFYPALAQAAPETGDVVEEARTEHQEAKAIIARIEALGAADATMDALVEQLAQAVEHHVKEERDELFPKARAAEDLDLDALGAQLREKQEALQAGAKR